MGAYMAPGAAVVAEAKDHPMFACEHVASLALPPPQAKDIPIPIHNNKNNSNASSN